MEIGKLYEIYSTDDECFSVGYLLCQNDDICIFKAFDDQGREAGIYAFKKRNNKRMPYGYGIFS